jgi:hypothetical protein
MKRLLTPLVPYMPVDFTGIGINPRDGDGVTVART